MLRRVWQQLATAVENHSVSAHWIERVDLESPVFGCHRFRLLFPAIRVVAHEWRPARADRHADRNSVGGGAACGAAAKANMLQAAASIDCLAFISPSDYAGAPA